MTEDLRAAVALGDLAEVRRLLESGADANLAEDGRTPLHLAVSAGHAEIAALLLAHGARHSTPDSAGRPSLDPESCPHELLHAIRQHYQRMRLQEPAGAVPDESRRWYEVLDEKGIVRASGLISDELLDRMRNEFEAFASKLARKAARGKAKYHRYDQEHHFIEADLAYETNNAFKYSPQLARFCCDERVVQTANLYLGKTAYIQRGVAMRYLPSPTSERGAFGWHHDLEEKRFKIMVLLTDVGGGDQCMSYIMGSHKLFHPYSMFQRNRCSPEYCQEHLGDLEFFDARGKAGDVFFFDSNGAHRGNRREGGQVRDVFTVEYTADKSNFWGADIAASAFDGLSPESTEPFRRLLGAPKKWEQKVRRRAPHWVETLPKVETWL